MYSLVVIDDEYIVVDAVRAMLGRLQQPFEVVGWAYDGVEGLEVVKRHHPDLVISDIRMPGIDGLSLIEQAKEVSPDTVFVVISGYTEFEYARKALTLGVVDYIDKPISMVKLNDVLTRVSQKHLEGRQKQQREAQYRRILKEGMDAVIARDPKQIREQMEGAWKELLTLADSVEMLRQESYKVLCVIGKLAADQNPGLQREELVSWSELEQAPDEAGLERCFHQKVGRICSQIEKEQTGSSHRIIPKVLEYISTHYTEDIGLNELAERVEMSPAYLSALFKEEVGMSYIKYLTEMRMRRAKQLLAQGFRVNEVSDMVGYNNYRYFCDIFKKHVGVTPSEYRGSVRKRTDTQGNDG